MKGLKSRTAAWAIRILALAILAAYGLSLAARSGTVSGYVASRVERALASRTGRAVRVPEASLGLLPLSIGIRNLEIAGEDGSFQDPFMKIREASATLSMRGLTRGVILVDAVEVDGIALQWRGGESVRGEAGRGGRGPGRRVGIRRINVRNGSISYMGRTRTFGLDAEDLEATASSIPCESNLCVGGSARARSFDLHMGDHRLEGDATSLQFEYDGDSLKIPRFKVTGAGLRASGEAGWTLGEKTAGRLGADVATRGSSLRSLLGSFPVEADAFEAEITLTVAQGAPVINGRGRARNLVYRGDVRARSADGTFAFKDGTFTTNFDAAGVMAALGPLSPARGAALGCELTVSRDGGASMKLRSGPILYDDVLSPIDSRLPRADIVARAHGEIAWQADDPGSLGGALDLNIEPAPVEGELPQAPEPPDREGRPRIGLTGSSVLRIAPDHVALEGGRLRAPGLQAGISGTIRPETGRADIKIRLEEAALGPTLRLLALVPAAALAEGIGMDGRAAGDLRVAVRPSGTTVSGRLDSGDLSITLEGDPMGPIQATTTFEVAGDRIGLSQLQLLGPGWSISGGADLDLGQEWPVRRASARMADLPSAPLWKLAGLPALEGGDLSGSLHFDLDDGSGQEARGRIDLDLKGAILSGIDVTEAQLSATERGGTLQVDRLSAESAAGDLLAEGRYSPGEGRGSFSLSSSRISLEALAEILAPGREGTRGSVSLSGTLLVEDGGARFEGEGRGEEVAILGFPLGAVGIPSITYGLISEGAVAARLEAPEIGVSGDVQAPSVPGGPFTVDLTARDLDLLLLRPLMESEILPGLGGRADLRLEGVIPPEDLLEADLAAQVEALTLEAGGLSFRADGPSEITLHGGSLRLDRMRLVGEGTDLSLSALFDLRTGAAGTGNLSGRFDAGLLALLVPGLDARGQAEVELVARGTGEVLEYSGRLKTEGIRLDHPDSPSPVDDLRVLVSVGHDGILNVERISFDFAGGHVTGAGTGQLEGINLDHFEIHLTGNGMSTEPIPDLAILFDAEATISARDGRARLEGRADVVRAIYRKEFGLQAGGQLGGGRIVPGEAIRAGGPFLALDFDIVAPGDVLVRNRSAQLEGSANLKVEGTFTRPEFTGRISIFEGGTFRFREVTYRSAGGGILFDDPDLVDPLLDFKATTDVKDYAITLHVLGRYSKPRFELSSEPALSQRDIVSLLMTGDTYGAGLGPEFGATYLAEENVTQYLTAPITETLESTVGRALGLTSVALQPEFVNGRADPTARLTLTKRVSPQILLTFSDNLGTAQDEIYQFEYELSRAWQLIGTRDRDGSVSGDLRFRLHWGGPPRTPNRPAAGSAPDGKALEISRVRFTGSPFDDTSKLRKRARVKPGHAWSRANALEGRESLRNYLVRRGYPLASVRMEVEEQSREGRDPGMDLLYDISPGLHVNLDFEGVRREGAYKKAVRDAWQRGIHLDDLAATGRRALEDHLGLSGYAAAEVSPAVIKKENRVRISYRIDRGPKVSLRSLRFSGATAVSEEALRLAMSSREDRWNTSGIFRPPVLAEDLQAIRAVYLSEGFLEAIVQEPEITFSEDRKEATVVIPVIEGDSWRVGEVALEGTTTYPRQSLIDATLLSPGSVLRPSKVASAEERLRDLLDANGYHAVRVSSRIEGPAEKARVVFVIEEGPRRVVDRISIRGNARTARRVIQREIDLLPGDPVSRNALLEIQRKLYALGLFRAVNVQTEPLPEDPARAKVIVDLVEGDPILTALGIGYNTEEQFQGLAQVGHNNVFGSGRAVSLLLRGSGVNRRAQASVSDRRLFGIPFEGIATVGWEERERESFNVRNTSAGVQFRKRLSSRYTALGRYSLSDVDLLDVDIDPGVALDEEDREILDEAVRLAQFGGSIARDTRDDILAPTRGSFMTADLGLYAQAFGSGESFSRLFLSASRFKALRNGVVFGASARLGQEEPLGRTEAVPLAERFFSGGDNTLRGFKVDEAGPLDYTSEEPIGGEFTLLLNAEMRFPIYRALKGVLFYDMGNTFLGMDEFRLNGTEILTTEVVDPNDCAVTLTGSERTCPVVIQDGLRHTLGVGVRLDTPVGPIRLEVGRKMDRRFGSSRFDLGSGFSVRKAREESLYEIFLSIGQAF